MDEELQCPICLEICEDAVETKCCHRIYCVGCLDQLDLCPSCRAQPLNTVTAYLARRIIGNMMMDCPLGCGGRLPRSEISAHLKNCPILKYKCPGPDCDYEGDKEGFAQHLAAAHRDILVSKAENLFEPASHEDVAVLKPEATPTQAGDSSLGQINLRGVRAFLGDTGKYYCGQLLNGHCMCCTIFCGPKDGCNCWACMKLDVWRQRLDPGSHGWLVNRAGAPAHPSIVTGKFYCGRQLPELVANAVCDGFCGPTYGPNCFPCQKLDAQARTRYETVWAS